MKIAPVQKSCEKNGSKHEHFISILALDRPRRCHSCCYLTMNGFHTSQALSTLHRSKGRAFGLAFPHTSCFVPCSAYMCVQCCNCHPGTQGFNRFGAGAVHLGYHQLDILRLDALLIHLALLHSSAHLVMRSALGYTPGYTWGTPACTWVLGAVWCSLVQLGKKWRSSISSTFGFSGSCTSDRG